MAAFQEETRLEVLRRLYQTPAVIQRALARELGSSLGSINFCFQALVEKGLVKMHNFQPEQEQAALRLFAHTRRSGGEVETDGGLLRRKVAGYEALQAEIETLKVEMESVKDAPH